MVMTHVNVTDWKNRTTVHPRQNAATQININGVTDMTRIKMEFMKFVASRCPD